MVHGVMVPLKSENFFCVGWAIENKFLESKNFWGLVVPIGVPLFVGSVTLKRHIYDIFANNPCFLRANLML